MHLHCTLASSAKLLANDLVEGVHFQPFQILDNRTANRFLNKFIQTFSLHASQKFAENGRILDHYTDPQIGYCLMIFNI